MMNLIMWVEHNSILAILVVFLLIVLTTYWPGRKSKIEAHGRIPFEDER
jgi:cbb3-type cytochrome oxidase subunit 3